MTRAARYLVLFANRGALRGPLLALVFLGSCAPQPAEPPRSLTVAIGDRKPESASSSAPQPTIRLGAADEPTHAPFEVVGLTSDQLKRLASAKFSPEQWQALLAVFAEVEGVADPPPMLGSYEIKAGAIVFRPRFPLQRGLKYRAVFHPERLPGAPATAQARPVRTEVMLSKLPASATTALAHVYPSAPRLPANLLKFYLQFSAPMSRGEVYQYIHLLGSSGKPLDRPFLEIGEELWDRSGTRLTVLLDPGRIKKGLRPREELGPILVEGKAYTLRIDRAWPDAAGNPLRDDFTKEFQTGPPVEERVDTGRWRIQTPAAGSRAPVSVEFPAPLDRAMLEGSLAVTDSKGRPLRGTARVEADETRWQFTPQAAWTAAGYMLVADTTLEDLAGNNIARPFEVDEFHPVTAQVTVETVSIPFQVRSAK